MTSHAVRQRRIAYAVAVLATAVAVAWASRLPAADGGAPVVAVRRPAPAASGAAVTLSLATARAGSVPVARDPSPPVSADPFAPLDGVAVLSPLAATQAAAASSASLAPAPIALPLVYVGRWVEQGAAMAILQEGTQLVYAKAGETVEGRFQVASVDDDRVVIDVLPAHDRRVLALRATDASPADPGTSPRTEGGPASSGSPDSTD